MNTPQSIFGQLLEQVAGSAFRAAGYQLQENTMHQSRGLFRFRKDLAEGISVYVEFQLLHYQQGGPSRFRVNLLRSSGPDARAGIPGYERVETTLSQLLWEDFGVERLGSPDHWWLFNAPQQLAQALAEAGQYVLAFGMPWLERTLDQPPPED